MQLLLVRHALPLRSEPGQGADPDLSDEGRAQVAVPPAVLSEAVTGIVARFAELAAADPEQQPRLADELGSLYLRMAGI